MNQALYAHMNNKRKMKKKKIYQSDSLFLGEKSESGLEAGAKDLQMK
jgi:hypothetical protein